MDKKKIQKQLEHAINAMLKYNATFEDRYRTRAFNLVQDAKMELSKSDWISVKDRLPDLDDSVLVRNENDPEDMWFAHRTDRNDVVVDKNGFAAGYNSEITHWQKIEV